MHSGLSVHPTIHHSSWYSTQGDVFVPIQEMDLECKRLQVHEGQAHRHHYHNPADADQDEGTGPRRYALQRADVAVDPVCGPQCQPYLRCRFRDFHLGLWSSLMPNSTSRRPTGPSVFRCRICSFGFTVGSSHRAQMARWIPRGRRQRAAHLWTSNSMGEGCHSSRLQWSWNDSRDRNWTGGGLGPACDIVQSSNFVINVGFRWVRLPSEFHAYLCLFGFSVFPFFLYYLIRD